MKNSEVSALILAAGKGTRMKSNRAKVLHEIFFAPMVHHVLDALLPLNFSKIVVVTGNQRQKVEAALKKYSVTFAFQEEQLGTGHAVLCAEPLLLGQAKTILILCGDTPLIRTKTLEGILKAHTGGSAVLTVMTTTLNDPTNYGRIITGHDGSLQRIVEEKDASAEQRAIKEINAGIYCVNADFLFSALRKVGMENKQGEMYLTDIVGIANNSGFAVDRFLCDDAADVLGVNSRVELAEAHRLLQYRRNSELMLSGVTLLHPESIFVQKTVSVGKDSVVHPNTFLTGDTFIGEGCTIGPHSLIHDSRIGKNATVGPFSLLTGVMVADNEGIKPFSNLSGMPVP